MSEPPATERPSRASQPEVRCPFCGASDAEPFALFGSQLLTEQWYCRSCRTPFERIKDDKDPVETVNGGELGHHDDAGRA